MLGDRYVFAYVIIVIFVVIAETRSYTEMSANLVNTLVSVRLRRDDTRTGVLTNAV